MRAERVPAAPEKVPEMLDTPTSQLIIVKIHKESSFLGSFYIYIIKLIRFSSFFIMKYKLYRRIFILFCIFLFRINCIFLFYHYYSAFFVGKFRGKVSKYLSNSIIFLNTSVIFWNTSNILWYTDKYTFYTSIIVRYISNLKDVCYNIHIIKRKKKGC